MQFIDSEVADVDTRQKIPKMFMSIFAYHLL